MPGADQEARIRVEDRYRPLRGARGALEVTRRLADLGEVVGVVAKALDWSCCLLSVDVSTGL